MAIRTEKCFSGYPETLQVHLVTDPVTGPRKQDAEFGRGTLEEPVVVRALKSGLQCVVVDVADGKFRPYRRNTDGCKFQ